MCSIAGAPSFEEVKEMLACMKHRAPDESGISFDGEYAIGMGRLKIIDLLSKGLAPIELDDLTLTFNGEVYNYIELREELKALGHVFKTQGDSEVLIHAYQAWGPESLQKLNWMGAFAIRSREGIFIARDLAGEKPLYYQEKPFRFASEAKALGFNCTELPRGHYAFFNSSLEIVQWWNFRPVPISKDPVSQLDHLLEDSVRLRTRAHVPYGLYYSGGIDSTLISTYHSFTHQFTYTDGDFKEDFNAIFPKILWHLDYPIKSFSAYGLWKLAEKASKEVKVVLSGEGADELFGGYVRYIPNEFNRLARQQFPSYEALFPYKDMQDEEFNGNMQELLRMGDRMAAAWGIENRCPFLDRRIVEFAMSLPMEWKIKGFETKVILRELIKRRKPDYQFEEKKGLYCSVNEWIGSTDKFGKNDYLHYQEALWKKFSSPDRVVS